jgi:hypothetical protein
MHNVGYLYALVVIALLFAVLHYFTELTLMHKLSAVVILLVIVAGAYLYNRASTQRQEQIMQNVQRFEIGKNLRCGDKDVNQTNYTLSIGTYTFIGKENTPYYGEMVSVSSCK